MPHIVLGDPAQREPIIGPGNIIKERYLGVWVSNSPDELVPNQPTNVLLKLMYWPDENYEGVAEGATFTVREGPRIVGFGTVLSNVESEDRSTKT